MTLIGKGLKVEFKAGDRVVLVSDNIDYNGKTATVREQGNLGSLEEHYLQKGYLPVRFDGVDYGYGDLNCHSSWTLDCYRHLTKLEKALA